MEYEVINMTKIKDGLYIGDEVTGTNLEFIIQFKITHIINAAGNQINNEWQSIGIKYTTLNWTESPNQNLLDSKDELVNKIVNFIDDSDSKGEGVLIHCTNSNNRACIVVLIYLMKKYRWDLNKGLEYIKSKKKDVKIPSYFLDQLNAFQARLTKIGQKPVSFDFNENYYVDYDEEIITHTYLNSKKNINSDQRVKNIKGLNKKISWDKPISTLLDNKIFLVRDTKLKMKTLKSCMKNKNKQTNSMFCHYEEKLKPHSHNESGILNTSVKTDLKDNPSFNYYKKDDSYHSNDLLSKYTNINISSDKNQQRDYDYFKDLREHIDTDIKRSQQRLNNFTKEKDNREAHSRSNSVKNERNKPPSEIIITNKIENIFYNRNNISIENPVKYERSSSNISRKIENGYEDYLTKLNDPIKSDQNQQYKMILGTKPYNIEKEQYINTSSTFSNIEGKIFKSAEYQKPIQNNFLYNSTKLEKPSNPVFNRESKPNTTKPNMLNYNISSLSVNKNPISKNPINNYQPNIIKPSNNISVKSNGFIQNNNKTGPIRIHNEYGIKPSTPDLYNNTKLSQARGSIKRSNSKRELESKEYRPSTAPQTEDRSRSLIKQPSHKRLVSPLIKNEFNTSYKALDKNKPSPQNFIKSSSFKNINKYNK